MNVSLGIILFLGIVPFFGAVAHINYREEFCASQTRWLTKEQLRTLREARTPGDFGNTLYRFFNSNRNTASNYENMFEGCLSYFSPKLNDQMDEINWFFEKQATQSPFEKVDIKLVMWELVLPYEENIEDQWELESFKYCRNVLENRQPKPLYQFLDWLDPMAVSTAIRYYQTDEYVQLVDYIGQNFAEIILDENFELMKNVSRRISNLCDYGLKNLIDNGNYQKYRKARHLKYYNAAWEYVEHLLSLLPNHQDELKAAYRMCQRLEEISPVGSMNEVEERSIARKFRMSKCAEQLKETDKTSLNFHNYTEYLDVVLNFYKTSSINETSDCAQENLNICVGLLNKELERTAYSCYREKQRNITHFLTEHLCVRDNGAKKHMGSAFEKTYSSTLQTLEEVCQNSLDLMCRSNFGTELQKDIKWNHKPTFDTDFYKKLKKFDKSRLWFKNEQFEELLEDKFYDF